MITRKALLNKLDEMNRRDVLVAYADCRNLHVLTTHPVVKLVCELVGVAKISDSASTYTDKRGHVHSSPEWLVKAYRMLVLSSHNGYDIYVRTVIATLAK